MQQKYGTDPLRQVNYTYDAVDQLTGEAATGGTAGSNYSNAFSYDAMGNRLKRETTQGSDTSSTRSSVNTLNQLTSVSTSLNSGPSQTSGLSYDVAGNLTEAATANGGRTIYVYDDADRLFRIEKRNAADVPLSKSEFIYDYASRKAVSQEFTFTAGAWVKSSEKRRVFHGLDVVQERNELNQVTAQLVRDGNIGGILSRSTSAGASFFGYDGGGNVTLLSDATGNEVGRYRYDAFGNTLEITGARAAENPYRFSTKELHAASGLYDFGYRFYSAGLGRWINRDPIGEDGGINLYQMVKNDPLNKIDEYGHMAAVAIPLAAAGPPGWVAIGVLAVVGVGYLIYINYQTCERVRVLQAKGDKSAEEYDHHQKGVDAAREALKDAEDALRRAKGKGAQDALKRQIESLKKAIRGHLKEMGQKWPGGRPQ